MSRETAELGLVVCIVLAFCLPGIEAIWTSFTAGGCEAMPGMEFGQVCRNKPVSGGRFCEFHGGLNSHRLQVSR